MGKITVVGSYIVALVIDTDRIPVEGETLTGYNYHATHGGKGSNMACCAARLGAESAFMGKIGRDAFGEDFLALLKEEGVHTGAVLYSEKLSTGIAFIISSKTGTNVIVIDTRANSDFLPDDIRKNRQVIESSDVILSPLEISLDTALEGARTARAAGVRAILNPAPATDLRGADLSGVFALTPNETEARICLGLSPEEGISDHDLARALHGLGAEHVILTLGEKGALWASKTELVHIPALKVNVVDTVGAGDAFNTGLAVGLSENLPVIESIAMGVVTASLSTRKRETIGSYPYREEVDARMGDLLKII